MASFFTGLDLVDRGIADARAWMPGWSTPAPFTQCAGQVLAGIGRKSDVLDSGCCGLAGNFGFERGHYEVSQACGERVLFPAIRAGRDASVVADGYSCRNQIRQAAGGAPVHLAAAVVAPVRPNRA